MASRAKRFSSPTSSSAGPPDNRQPLPEEMESCSHIWREQIAILKPESHRGPGAVATKGLLGVTRESRGCAGNG